MAFSTLSALALQPVVFSTNTSFTDTSLNQDSHHISSFLVSAAGLLGVLENEFFVCLHFPFYKIKLIEFFPQITGGGGKKKTTEFQQVLNMFWFSFFFCPDYLQ